jgi:accessory gene regulator protein AgrB
MLNEYEFNGGTLNGVGLPEIVQKVLIASYSVCLQKTTTANHDVFLRDGISVLFDTFVYAPITSKNDILLNDTITSKNDILVCMTLLAQYNISDIVRREIIELISQIHKEINLNSPIDLEETQ